MPKCKSFEWLNPPPNFCRRKSAEKNSNNPPNLEGIIPIVDIDFRCIDMFGQSSKSVPKKRFCPCPCVVTGECPGKFGSNFHIAVISRICVQVWLRSV